MNTYVIQKANWHISIANAIKNASDGDKIIVSNESQKQLAAIAAKRAGKEIKFVVCT